MFIYHQLGSAVQRLAARLRASGCPSKLRSSATADTQQLQVIAIAMQDGDYPDPRTVLRRSPRDPRNGRESFVDDGGCACKMRLVRLSVSPAPLRPGAPDEPPSSEKIEETR
jgi:hypothetical protein